MKRVFIGLILVGGVLCLYEMTLHGMQKKQHEKVPVAPSQYDRVPSMGAPLYAPSAPAASSSTLQFQGRPGRPAPVPPPRFTPASSSSPRRPLPPIPKAQASKPLPQIPPKQVIPIPLTIDTDEEETDDEEDVNIVKQGKIKDVNTTLLKLDEKEPLTQKTFRQLLDEKNEMPFIIAVVKTRKKNGNREHIIHRIFDAQALNEKLQKQKFKERYRNGLSIKDPISDILIDGPIYYFALLNRNEPFMAIGTDIDYLKSSDESEIKKFMDYMFQASNRDAWALNSLGKIFADKGSPVEYEFFKKRNPNSELSKYFYELSFGVQPSDYAAYNIGLYYYEKKMGRKAKEYLVLSKTYGCSHANFALGLLYERGMPDLPRDIGKAKNFYNLALQQRNLDKTMKERVVRHLRKLNN